MSIVCPQYVEGKADSGMQDDDEDSEYEPSLGIIHTDKSTLHHGVEHDSTASIQVIEPGPSAAATTKPTKDKSSRKRYPKPTSLTRSQMKIQLITLGYTLAAQYLGYSSFTELLEFAGSFKRARGMLRTFTKGAATPSGVASMIEALLMRKFAKQVKLLVVVGDGIKSNEGLLEKYDVGKMVKKWGGVYKRVWKVKLGMEEKGKGVKVKGEEVECEEVGEEQADV